MSGRFLNILMRLLGEHRNDPVYSLARARFDAVKELSEIPKDKPYGPRALIYSLIGNGGVRLCPVEAANP
jgi:hypothetical protein